MHGTAVFIQTYRKIDRREAKKNGKGTYIKKKETINGCNSEGATTGIEKIIIRKKKRICKEHWQK